MSKTYPSWLKALAVASVLAVPIFIISMLGSFMNINYDFKYSDFYDWEITDGKAEKVSDSVYRVTLTLKNHSAYRVTLYDWDIRVTCNGGEVDKINIASYDSRLLDCLKNPILPAGQTTEYSFDIVLPPNAEFITFGYYGVSYTKQEYMQIQGDRQRVYSLEL